MTEVMNKKVVAIEYPRQDETIKSDCYTFRIAAMPGAKKVEVSIDDSGYKPCRQAGGSWWYDWSGYCSGDHEMTARIHLADGHFHTSERRDFTVELEDSACAQNGGERRTISPRRAQQYLARPEVVKHMASKFVVVVPNEPGVMRQLTELLAQERVNIDSMLMETTGDVASFRFLLEDGNGLRPTLESEGFHVVEDKVFRLELSNRPGELDRLTRMLMEKGVCVRYLYGTSHGQTTKVVLAVDRPAEAVAVVKEMGQRCVSADL